MTNKPANRNPIWDTLVFVFGEPPPAQTKLYGKVCADLGAMNATPDGIIEAVTAIAAEWGKKAVTPTSVAKWYTRHQGALANLPDDPDEIRMAMKFADLERQFDGDGKALPE